MPHALENQITYFQTKSGPFANSAPKVPMKILGIFSEDRLQNTRIFLYFCELVRNRRPELFYPRILSDSTGIFVCTAEQCHGAMSQKTISAATPVYDLHQLYSTLLLL